jgi:Holliday junction resolvasome RuvABC endonuclease subunit
MRILALDQSSRVSGWAVFDGDTLIEYGKFDVGSIYELGERLHQIRLKVKNLIDKYEVDKVILEDIYMDGQRVNNV